MPRGPVKLTFPSLETWDWQRIEPSILNNKAPGQRSQRDAPEEEGQKKPDPEAWEGGGKIEPG